MTPEDRRVLSLLMEKVKKINARTDHTRYIYFLNKCIEEAQKRSASSFLDRFKDMRDGARLSHRAFESKREIGQRLASMAGVHIYGVRR